MTSIMMKKFMIYQKTILCILIGCFSHSLAGQSLVLPEDPIQQWLIGAAGQDELVSIAVNWRGDLAAIGNTTRGAQGGQDLVFATFDAQLNVDKERHIGRSGEDGVGKIAVLPDGRYVVVGYSTRPSGAVSARSKYIGKKDGWILILDEKGDTEQELLLGSSDDDMFRALVVGADGSVWAAGNSGEDAWVVHLNPQFQVVWERRLRFKRAPSSINAIALTTDRHLYFTGSTSEAKKPKLWVGGLTPAGDLILDKTFPTLPAEEGTGIVILDAQTLALCGTVYDPQNRENGFVSILDRKGTVLQQQTLGGREYDRLNFLGQLSNGRLLAVGSSASFERGSRRISAWMNILNDKADLKQAVYYGSKLDDEAAAAIEHPDGRLFALGTTARQVLKMRQGWLFQLTDRAQNKTSTQSIETLLLPIRYKQQDIALAGERLFIPFSLKNTSKKAQYNLRALLTPRNASAARLLKLTGGRSILLPPVAGETMLEWGLPLQFAEGNPGGTYQIQVQFFQGDSVLGKPHTVEVKLGTTALPRLVLTTLPLDSSLSLGHEGFLPFVVHNAGDQIAKNLTLSVMAPPGTRVPDNMVLGDLPAGARMTYRLPILPENVAVGPEAIRLTLRVSDENLVHTATAQVVLGVVTGNIPPKAPAANYTVAVWVYPNPDHFDQSAVVWTQEEITVQVKIVSSAAVTRQQFCLEINGQPCQTGAKFDEVQIKGDKNSKTFSQTLRLLPGENKILAHIKTATGEVQSEALKIVYAPAKPNLHIISIGIPSADLKYTVKDARNFTTAFANSPNNAFGKIFMDTLLTEGRTTKTEILKALRRMQYRYTDLQILPKDLLVIFVSGHGLGAYDGRFRLAASDYDGPFLEETSLDFEQEIVNYLQTLPCQKLFFVDACHSGTASSTGLAGIAARKNGLNMLVSCQPNELSYEDDSWQNGAFTATIVRAIEQFGRQAVALDSNTDGALDAAELFTYIEKEVPKLVEKKRPKTTTSQHPKLFLAAPEKALILFEK